MNLRALLGIVLIVYGLAVGAIAYKKPRAVWDLKKIQIFLKVLGEKGTMIFFYIFAAIALGVGIFFMTYVP